MNNTCIDTKKENKKKTLIIISLVLLVIIMFFVCLFIGSANMSLKESFMALAKKSTNANNRIIWNIRFPRVLAAVIAGAGLAVAGHIMQTSLNNVMASPSTLGVSNAAVFGANLSIIGFAGGFLTMGKNMADVVSTFNPFAVSGIAFAFSIISVLMILGFCKIKNFSPNTVVLAGIAIGSIWTAATTILQFYATDVGLSAAVIWSFGDLGRATYKQDFIMLGVVVASIIMFVILSWRFNAMLSGDNVAKSVGVRVDLLRFIALLTSSLITAVCVSFLGIIGFVGIICPHVVKKLIGHNHTVSIPTTALAGSLLLLIADTLSRSIGNGSALPVGAITALLGAPFFLVLLFSKKERA
ncbi:MAG: iron ABC transporter permease [Bacilli bacterium]|nr:iron ABC transporter permease [Bacilli bacterium]